MSSRTGVFLMVLAWAPFLASFVPFHMGGAIPYGLMVAAHLFNVGGYLLTAISDGVARRPFSITRLVYVLAVELMLGIFGPLVMSAAAAALKSL